MSTAVHRQYSPSIEAAAIMYEEALRHDIIDGQLTRLDPRCNNITHLGFHVCVLEIDKRKGRALLTQQHPPHYCNCTILLITRLSTNPTN